MESKSGQFTLITWVRILCLGLLVGTLDICTAMANYYISTGENPVMVFKYISSGIVGMEAFSGDTGIVVMGLLLHYVVALLFTAFFFILSHNIKSLSKHKFFTGIIYGIFIWAVMNLLVVPLSNTPKSPFNMFNATKEMLILIIMIGLPLSFLSDRVLPIKRQK